MKVTYSLKSGSLVIALFVLASLSLPSAAFGQMRVFATSIAYDGDLGGLVGADGICKTLASNAGLPGTYKAWLSDSSRAPSTRFIQSSGPYVLVDGTMIANNWADLVDGTLANPINLDENGSTVNNFAWTGTSADGTANPLTALTGLATQLRVLGSMALRPPRIRIGRS